MISLALLSSGTLVYSFFSNKRSAQIIQSLSSGSAGISSVRAIQNSEDRAAKKQFERLKSATRRSVERSSRTIWRDRYFRAGFFASSQQKIFRTLRGVLPFALFVVGAGVGAFFSIQIAIASAVLGIALGLQLPLSYLNRVTERRNEEIMYYLPLVVDQIVIGVSGSLDISPCIASVIAMADERDTHNPVTELLKYAQQYMKSGVSIDDALSEVGTLSGHTELKHVFIALSQVAKHGGEITKQLQELAKAVSQQRETKVEARIKALELEATGPVGLVFLAFMGVLLIGIGTQIMEAFQ